MPKSNKNNKKNKNKKNNKSNHKIGQSKDKEMSENTDTDKQVKLKPFVSICTPTFNRRPFIPYMIKCFEHQTYPMDRIEWIIIDDGTDPIEDLVKDIEQVKYFYYEEKMLLGKKRNLMHSKCSGDIIIYMDDDDYYPPERISHAVETLEANPTFLAAGSSEMHIYFDCRKQVYQCGPYKEFHATAATFAFKKELLLETGYNEENAVAEERHFLKNYTIPLKQLDTLKSIMVFSHKHNSLNKEKLLDNLEATRTTLSRYSVDDFISDPILKQFYMVDMNHLLTNYEPGKPEHKPKMLEQIKKMDEERKKRLDDHNKMIMSQNRIFQNQSQNQSQIQIQNQIEEFKKYYEKQISDKTYLINELLKKIKDMNTELNHYRSK
jgi:glycosyltransferase involved in cell wall biosynthesis